MTMITVKALVDKLNLISFSDEQLFSQAASQVDLSRVRCPVCGSVGRCCGHSSYVRTMITVVNGRRKEVEVEVPRVLCESCHHTHSLLPDVLIPHGSYSLRFILFVLEAYLKRTEPVAALCERWAISVSTLYDWIHLFRDQHNLWARVLERIAWVTESALAKIRDIPSFPSRFFAQFGFPFLHGWKTAASHPNGRGGGVYFSFPHNSEIDV